MKKILFAVLIVFLLFAQTIAVSALTASEAKQEWYNAKAASKTAQDAYGAAKIEKAANPTPENQQKVIDTGKDVLRAGLNEAEAWLNWQNLEVEENPEIPADLKAEIKQDVTTNLAKIPTLRTEIDGVTTEFELGVTFLKIVGKYFELLADVARNTGKVWAHIGTIKADTADQYEAQLRTVANGLPDNSAIIAKLDLAKTEIANARTNITNAKAEYEQVKIPGTPIIKFANGNNYLRITVGNLLSATNYLNEAYNLISSRSG